MMHRAMAWNLAGFLACGLFLRLRTGQVAYGYLTAAGVAIGTIAALSLRADTNLRDAQEMKIPWAHRLVSDVLLFGAGWAFFQYLAYQLVSWRLMLSPVAAASRVLSQLRGTSYLWIAGACILQLLGVQAGQYYRDAQDADTAWSVVGLATILLVIIAASVIGLPL